MSVLNQIQNRIEVSNKRNIKLRLIYSTSKHILSADDFHQHCDNKKPTLTILYSKHNVVFGGYTEETWSIVEASKKDPNAFIFTTHGGKLKVFDVRKDGYAIYCNKSYGPCFGQAYRFSLEFLTFHKGPLTPDGTGIYRLNGQMQKITSFGSEIKSISPTELNGGSMDVNRLEVYEVVCDQLEEKCVRPKQISETQLRQSLHGKSRCELKGMPFNILLVGQIGSGKSSFVNTALSAMSNLMNQSAVVQSNQQSATNKFSRYDLTLDSPANNKKIFLFDVRGLEDERGMTYELEPLLKGHLSLGYEFPDSDSDNQCDVEASVNGKSYGRMNIICFVIDSTTHNFMSEKILAKIEDMKQIANKLEVQWVIVVTKLDVAYEHIRKNHDNIFKSSSAQEDFEKISDLFGIGTKHVYPVINYTSQENMVGSINQLVLHALSSMVKLVEEQEISKKGTINKQESWSKRDCSADYKSHVRKMKEEMSDLPRQPDFLENPMRILMVGSIDSGKTSFINSLCSALAGRIIRKINLTSGGVQGQSKTKEYRAYQLKLKHENGQEEKLPVRVCDMPGWAYSTGQEKTTPFSIKMADIVNTVEGRLKSGHKFTEDNLTCNENPDQSKKVHGMCIVLSMTECRDERATTQINKIIESLETIPRLIILTKIDEYCTSVNNIYQNSTVLKEAMHICAQIPAVKLSDIYPVRNYVHEAYIDDSLDLLILDAFKTLIDRCKVYLETLQEQEDED